MSDYDIEPRVHKIIAQVLGVESDRVRNDAVLVTDLDADSLDQVELLMTMEQEFGLSFGQATVKLTTVRDVVDYIAANIPSAASAA
jgi:acyl carrier protein